MDAGDKGGRWWTWIGLLTLPPMKRHAPGRGITLLMELPRQPANPVGNGRKEVRVLEEEQPGTVPGLVHPMSITTHKVRGETTVAGVSGVLQDGTAYERGC